MNLADYEDEDGDGDGAGAGAGAAGAAAGADAGATAGAAAADLADRWIVSRYNRCALEVTAALEDYDLGLAAQRIYEFFWDEFCDWYIELIKPRLYGREAAASRRRAQGVLARTLRGALSLLHPFMPFITEELWQHLPHRGETIMLTAWEHGDKSLLDDNAEETMALMMETVKAVRNLRSQFNVPPGKKADLVMLTDDGPARAILASCREYIANLAAAEHIRLGGLEDQRPGQAVTAVVRGVEIYLPLAGLVDMRAEQARLRKEGDKVRGEIRGLENKLANEGFRAKAPAEVVAKEEEKLAGARYRLQALETRLAIFGDEVAS
jgi:valyl-tRNA synthetase